MSKSNSTRCPGVRALLCSAAGVLGLSLQAGAATTVYTITDGAFSSVEASCTQITYLFAGVDCTYGRNRPGSTGVWVGYLFGGGHYAPGSPADSPSYWPTHGEEVPLGSGNFVPAANDGKIEAVITGTLSIDDNGTPGIPADDMISSTFSIGPMVRNVSTGQFTRAVQGWTSMDHQMAAITVSSAVANGNGGIDYVIGSRGFPVPECSATDSSDCLPTANAMYNFDNSPFYTDIAPGSVGIERIGILGEPSFVLVVPPPNPPTGNVGATSTATFTGLTCVHNNTSADDCAVNQLVWGGGESAGFDNIIMKVSTNSAGAITSALAYYTQEYRIGFGAAAEPGYDNSVDAGTFSFTAPSPGIPDADEDGVADGLDNCPASANSDQLDTDEDGRGDVCDNCTLVVNALPDNVPGTSPPIPRSQLDSDHDGYGNACDGDLNNSGLTTALDTTLLRNVLNQLVSASPAAAAADLNGSGQVTASDNTLLRIRLNSAPGPSGLACAGTIPCPAP